MTYDHTVATNTTAGRSSLSPYITPEILTSAPTGVAWSTIPPGKNITPAQRLAEQSNICMRVTALIDGYINQSVRATVDTEYFNGPDYRVTLQPGTGNIRIMTQRIPVLSVVSIQVSPNVFPHQYTTVPTNMYEPEYLPIGVDTTSAPTGSGSGGDSIIMGAGYMGWGNGRNGYRLKVTYINGWPHSGLTSSVAAGAVSLPVDDCTGFSVNGPTSAVVYDSGQQEVVSVTAASTTSGAGNLTIASGLQFAHSPGVLVSTIPGSIMWGGILWATAQALTRGATSTTVHEIPGGGQSSSGKAMTMVAEAKAILNTYRRVI